MSSFPHCPDIVGADIELLPIESVAHALDLPHSRVVQMLRDHQLIAIKRGKEFGIPAQFIDGDHVLKQLPGLIAVLRDGGWRDEEVLHFLFTDDPSLPGKPMDALHGHLAREVIRRAQAMAF
ncbi:MAG: DNA-binding protein [Nocardiaceae bacterium]|nr:DNA-binding protein [Nocardiaceae bacterium]